MIRKEKTNNFTSSVSLKITHVKVWGGGILKNIHPCNKYIFIYNPDEGSSCRIYPFLA